MNPSLTGNMLSRDMAKLLKVTSNGRSYYVEKLKKGEIVGVAVGGVEEACFDFDYNTEWGSRTGFANVALEAGKEIKLNLTSSIKGQSRIEQIISSKFSSPTITKFPKF